MYSRGLLVESDSQLIRSITERHLARIRGNMEWVFNQKSFPPFNFFHSPYLSILSRPLNSLSKFSLSPPPRPPSFLETTHQSNFHLKFNRKIQRSYGISIFPSTLKNPNLTLEP